MLCAGAGTSGWLRDISLDLREGGEAGEGVLSLMVCFPSSDFKLEIKGILSAQRRQSPLPVLRSDAGLTPTSTSKRTSETQLSSCHHFSVNFLSQLSRHPSSLRCVVPYSNPLSLLSSAILQPSLKHPAPTAALSTTLFCVPPTRCSVAEKNAFFFGRRLYFGSTTLPSLLPSVRRIHYPRIDTLRLLSLSPLSQYPFPTSRSYL